MRCKEGHTPSYIAWINNKDCWRCNPCGAMSTIDEQCKVKQTARAYQESKLVSNATSGSGPEGDVTVGMVNLCVEGPSI